MSNRAGMVEPVKVSGMLPSFLPADMSITMVAPDDLGETAARRHLSGPEDVGLKHIEGTERYTANNAASAFATAIGRNVQVQEIPREALEETFRSFGFSDEAAASYACMTRRMIDGKTDTAHEPVRGKITLQSYITSTLD